MREGPATTSTRLVGADLDAALEDFPSLKRLRSPDAMRALEGNMAKPKPRQKSKFALNNGLDEIVKIPSVSVKTANKTAISAPSENLG